MKINLSKDKSEILEQLEDFIKNVLFIKYPFLKGDSTILVTGSVATNTYDKHSDIDLHIIRSENIEKENLNKLKEYKKELLSTESNIELRFSRTYEALFEYLNWNDDYILGEFQNSLVLYDADNKLNSLMKRFEWYPRDIYKDKIKWLLSEILIITERELLNSIERGHSYYVEVLRTKYLRFLLTLVRLLNRKYPVYDKKLFETTYALIETEELKNCVETILETPDYKNMLNKMRSTTEIILRITEETTNENLNQEDLRKFSTKNKIMFE